MNSPGQNSDIPAQPQYLWTSEALLSPEVDAVQIGELKTGQFSTTWAKMQQEASLRGIQRPLMVADLIFQEGMKSQLGSPGQPYPIAEEEWETFVKDVPTYCGDKIPKVYMIDGRRFRAPI